MDVQEPTVYLVEDDAAMRNSLAWMLRSKGFHCSSFETPGGLLEAYDPGRPGCLLLDLELPLMTGLELVDALRERGCAHPFIIITGHGEVAAAVEAMHSGALDFLEKPFEHRRLSDRVAQAIQQDLEQRQWNQQQSDVSAKIATLTPREREVMELVALGHLTKQIAKRLGISIKTVEVHRSRVTRKMKVDSVAQLVRVLSTYAESQHQTVSEVGAAPPVASRRSAATS